MKQLLKDIPRIYKELEIDRQQLESFSDVQVMGNREERLIQLANKLNIEARITENKRKLMNIKYGLLRVESDEYRQLLVDKYANRLTENQLTIKYMVSRSTIYRMIKKSEEELSQ